MGGDLYTLTLTNDSGQTETLGVTGYHRFYDQASGWVQVQNMYLGETLRGDGGDLKVTGIVRAPGLDRVYNMTVEGDHVYYVGDLKALVHNNCPAGEGGLGNYGDPLKGLENLGSEELYAEAERIQEIFGEQASLMDAEETLFMLRD